MTKFWRTFGVILAAFVAGVIALTAFQPSGATQARVAPPATLRVLAIGESLTQGYGAPDGCGYRTRVSQLAQLNSTNIVWTGPPNGGNPYQPGVDCPTGWRGGATLDVLTNSISTWLQLDQPDAVIIWTGTNNSSGAGGGLTNFQANYTGLIQTILNYSPNVRVYPMMIPYSSASWAANEVTANVAIIQSSWSFASRVTLIDPSGYPTRYMNDGIHPSDYTPIADVLFRGMAPAYNWKIPYGTTVMTGGSCRPGYERQPLQWTCPE
jgi:lysophospholipase L1-like esterase